MLCNNKKKKNYNEIVSLRSKPSVGDVTNIKLANNMNTQTAQFSYL